MTQLFDNWKIAIASTITLP